MFGRKTKSNPDSLALMATKAVSANIMVSDAKLDIVDFAGQVAAA